MKIILISFALVTGNLIQTQESPLGMVLIPAGDFCRLVVY